MPVQPRARRQKHQNIDNAGERASIGRARAVGLLLWTYHGHMWGGLRGDVVGVRLA